MDVLERDGETGEERRGQETKDGGIAEGDLEVKGRIEAKEELERREMILGGFNRGGERTERGENEMMGRVDSRQKEREKRGEKEEEA